MGVLGGLELLDHRKPTPAQAAKLRYTNAAPAAPRTARKRISLLAQYLLS